MILKRTYKAFLLLVFCLIGLICCKSIKEDRMQLKQTEGEATFLEKVKNADFSSIDFQNLTQAENEFLEVVRLIFDSDFANIESTVKEKMIINSKNPFKYEYLKFLTYSLFFQSKWKELLPVENQYYYDPDSVFMIAKVFSKVPKEEILFLKDLDTVKFFTAPNGAIILQVSVNGRIRNFLLDTGSNYSIVSSKTAEDCNLPILTREKSKAITHGETKVDVTPTYINSFIIGNLVLRNHPCLIVDDFNLKLRLIASNINFEIYGIIGWKAVQNAKLTIDYSNRWIMVEKPVKSKSKTANFFWFGVPIVVGEIYGKKILFTLDLGSEKSFLTNKIFGKIEFQRTYEQTKRIGFVGGWKFNPSIVVPYFELYLDTFKISFTDISTVGLSKDYFFNIDGILGLDFVKKVIISFDINNSEFKIRR